MAIDPRSGLPRLDPPEQRALTVARQRRTQPVPAAGRRAELARYRTGGDVVVSQVISVSSDGAVTTVLTYRDGRTVTTTSTAAGSAAYSRTGELQSAGTDSSHLLDILV